jgi:RimJ/RimL family protein N-acetyltransferase
MARPTELRTDRLHLRTFRASDVDGALAYRDDPEFARFLPHVPLPFTRADAHAFVARNMAESWETSPVFAVVLDGALIGTVNLEVETPGAAGARAAMLGYATGRRWWGQGLATEAARAVMEWAVPAYQLSRVWASSDVRNVRSHHVLQKLGMRRQSVRLAGTPDATE